MHTLKRAGAATLIATLMIALFVIVSTDSAWADSCSGSNIPAPGTGGLICIPAADPGSPSQPGGSDDPVKGSGDSGGSDDCNYFLADPQPAAGTKPWGGNSPDDGKVYLKDCGDGWAAYGFDLVFVPNDKKAPPPPNPAVLAQRALGQMKLTVPNVHLAPAPPAKTYVGLETWLWMPNGQWHSLTKSVKAGSTTVTVTAEPRKVVWNMGSGATTCHDAGRVWKVGHMSSSATTSCQYTYTRVSDFQPGKKFKVSATITFRANWTCSGNCLANSGSLGTVDGLPGTSAIRVGERQSVNVTEKGR